MRMFMRMRRRILLWVWFDLNGDEGVGSLWADDYVQMLHILIPGSLTR